MSAWVVAQNRKSRNALVRARKLQSGGPKVRPQTGGHTSVKSEPIYQTFSPEDSLVNFAVNWLLKVPLLLAHVATLPCEPAVAENKRLTINYKVV